MDWLFLLPGRTEGLQIWQSDMYIEYCMQVHKTGSAEIELTNSVSLTRDNH